MKLTKNWEVPFPIDLVYAAWVSSETVIPPATRMEIDPRLGGHYRLIMETPDFAGRNEGEFLVVEPGSRVKYTWEWNGDGEVTTIDVRFTGAGENTEVHMIHDGFTNRESAESHDSGWDAYIEGFIKHLDSR